MKHNSDWGNGQIRANNYLRYGRRSKNTIKKGGIGAVLESSSSFCLKVVSLLKNKDTINENFWHEATSVSLYSSVARNIPNCINCPIPAHYWINRHDPLYVNFPRKEIENDDMRSLADFISLFDIPREQTEKLGIDPDEYWLVPDKLLENIYENHKLSRQAYKHLPPDLHENIFKNRTNADILLTYPISRGHETIEYSNLVDNIEIKSLIYHILSAVLALYQNGLAHGDIKPKNIMEGSSLCDNNWNHVCNQYFLTDIGSVGSGDMQSETCTEPFFSAIIYSLLEKRSIADLLGGSTLLPDACKNKDEALQKLLCRTIMDGYALALTIWSLAYGSEIKHPPFLRSCVTKKWKDDSIKAIFDTLYDAKKLTIKAMQDIVDSLKNEIPPYYDRRSKPIKTYGRESAIRFEAKRYEEVKTEDATIKIEYGFFKEQFNCSKKHNPLIKFYGESSSDSFPDAFSMQPIVLTYSNSGKHENEIFYAPDDANSGSRTVDFEDYIPCSLDYLLTENKLTDELAEKLIEMGKNIDKSEKNPSALPYPLDIVIVDGQWKIQPFYLGGYRIEDDFSFEEYFKMLCGRENKLTPEHWAALLEFDHGVGILYELLIKDKDMISKIAEFLKSVKAVNEDELYPGDENWKKRRKIHFLKRLYQNLLDKSPEFKEYLRDPEENQTVTEWNSDFIDDWDD